MMNEPINNHKADGTYMNGDLPSLMSKLRIIDKENMKQLRRFSRFLAILIVFYAVLMILNPVLYLGVIVGGFAGFLGIFLYSYHKARKKDYSLPVKQLLTETRKSYKLVTPVFLLINVFSFAIIYTSLHTAFSRYIPVHLFGLSFELSVLVITVIFYAVMLVIAYLVWRARYHNLIRQIDECLKELGE